MVNTTFNNISVYMVKVHNKVVFSKKFFNAILVEHLQQYSVSREYYCHIVNHNWNKIQFNTNIR